MRVADCDTLEQWIGHLDEQSVPRSPIITAIRAWLVVVEDPDDNRVRLYTDEKHQPELAPEEDHPWISD